MSTLGMAAIAANAGLDAYDRRTQQQDQQQREGQRFDWESQRAKADLSTLDDRVKQQRTAAQLGAAQAQAGLDILPKQNALANTQLDTQQAAADGAKARQPDELVAQANQAKVQSILSQFNVDNTPRQIAQAKAQGALSEADVYVASMAKLGDLLSTNDPNTVIRFMNNMNDSGIFGTNTHAPVAKVGIVQDHKGGDNVFVASDAQGKPIVQIRAKDLQRIVESTKKADFKTVNAGDSLVRVQGGQATPVYTAPESATSKGAKASGTGPLERDVNYLVSAHGMSQDQALAHLNQAKSMSREQFILKGISDMQAMGRKPSEDDINQMGGLFDRAVGRQAPGKPASNSPDAGNMDPRIKSLIGLP